MSHSVQNTSLSLSARLLCYLGPPSVILLTSVASPRTALLSPLAFLPTAFFFRRWQKFSNVNPSRHGELQPMLWTYAAAGTVGLVSVALVQMVICKVASSIIFGSGQMNKDFWIEFQRGTTAGLTRDQLTHRTKLATSWQNWAFNSVFTFVAAGFAEETLKYLPIAYVRRRGTAKQRQQRNRAYIDYALAGALGFGLVEAIGFLYASCEQGHESWAQLVLIIFERVVIGQTAHLSVACLTALRAIRRDYYGDQLNWWNVVAPAALLHGAFDFVALSASALEGNVGWIHPTAVVNMVAMFGLCSGLVATAVWKIKQEWDILINLDSRRSLEDDSTEK
ncbi:hypothetical protein B7494_g4947 [Chlorociboria aeruginascens]|nr:hypothetical protein B7494_g4947 [Chlorociboria aeruginascens]